VRPERLALVRFAPDAPLPAWLFHREATFFSLTRTGAETSIVCPEDDLPPSVVEAADRGWRALEVDGPLPLDTPGILAGLVRPLAEAGVPVFVIATWDTDYLLVRDASLVRAIDALRREHDVLADAAAPSSPR
jgi:hypothetical protein